MTYAEEQKILTQVVCGLVSQDILALVAMRGLPGSGKALDLDAPVLTPDRGFIRMGDIALGDRVVDPHGEDSQVVGVYPQGILPVYRLTFSDGTWAEASGDHLWEIQDYSQPRIGHRKRGKGRFVTKIRTTDQIRTRVGLSRSRIQLPLLSKFDFDEGELPIDPYLLGFLLGDGSLAGGSIRVTIGEDDASESLPRITPLVPEGVSIKKISGTTMEYGITQSRSLAGRESPLLNSIRGFGLNVHSWDKFIPDIYKYSSFETRLAILQGLMDTDGNWTTAGAEFSSSSKQLRDDVVEVARSLGLVVRVQKDKETSYIKDGVRVPCRTAYRLTLTESEDVRVFRLERKLRKIHTRGRGQRKIVSVEYVGDRECQCIKVSAPSELFITKDYIPTHNTTVAKDVRAKYPNVVLVSRDDIRDMLFNKRVGLEPADETLVTTQQDMLIRNALRSGHSVIVHDLNLRPQYLTRFREIAKEEAADFYTAEMPLDVEEAVARDRTREAPVGEQVIRNIAKKFLFKGYLPMSSFKEAPEREVYVPDTSLPTAAIFDLDGTVAEANGRGWYDHHLVGNDHVRENIMELAGILWRHGVKIIFVSGRSDICKDITWNWLKQQVPFMMGEGTTTELHMRKDGDQRQDAQIKYEIFNEHIRNRFNVRWAFDDRDQVIRLWRDLGIDALQVNYGNF